MAKSSRFKYAYRKNASKLHKAVGKVLRTDPLLKHYKSYQEYPVSKVNPDYQNNSHQFDWIIADLKIVIEVMGQQNYEHVCFGGISKEEAASNYHTQVERDLAKKRAAEDAGWTYIAVKYNDTLDVERLVNIAIENNVPLKAPSKPVKPFKNKSNAMTPVQKEKAREARKKGYQRAKEWQKKVKEKS